MTDNSHLSLSEISTLEASVCKRPKFEEDQHEAQEKKLDDPLSELFANFDAETFEQSLQANDSALPPLPSSLLFNGCGDMQMDGEQYVWLF